MADNRVIGRDNAIPWHLPADLKRFKALTTSHPLLMGRRTYESIGQPLPNRRTIVLTRDQTYHSPGVEVAHDLDEAFQRVSSNDKVFVAGGAQIYRATLPRADRVYLTIVHTILEGDTYFPELDSSEWRLEQDMDHMADDRNPHSYTFQRYERRSQQG